MRLHLPHPRFATPRVAIRPPASPIPARLWLASAACEAAVALGAAGALFATFSSHLR